MNAPSRPDFAPENRSSSAGKLVAVSVFALLILGGLATLVVVLTRGSSGITPPPQEIPSSRQVLSGEAKRGDAPADGEPGGPAQRSGPAQPGGTEQPGGVK